MEKNISEPAGCRTPGRWKELLERELLERIIPFWLEFSIDREYGGFLTCLDREGNVFDGMKQMWMQWREVYMFAALCNSRFRRPEFLSVAEAGFDSRHQLHFITLGPLDSSKQKPQPRFLFFIGLQHHN